MNYRGSLGDGNESLSTVYVQYILDVIVQNMFLVFRMDGHSGWAFFALPQRTSVFH
jgi:hypothetical protein